MEYVKNKYGLTIKKCCASCQHKCFTDNEDYRKCALSKKRVTRDFVCLDWAISRGVDAIRLR